MKTTINTFILIISIFTLAMPSSIFAKTPKGCKSGATQYIKINKNVSPTTKPSFFSSTTGASLKPGQIVEIIECDEGYMKLADGRWVGDMGLNKESSYTFVTESDALLGNVTQLTATINGTSDPDCDDDEITALGNDISVTTRNSNRASSSAVSTRPSGTMSVDILTIKNDKVSILPQIASAKSNQVAPSKPAGPTLFAKKYAKNGSYIAGGYTRGGGQCYEYVWKNMKKTAGITESMGTRIGVPVKHAYQFADWADRNPRDLERHLGLKKVTSGIKGSEAPLGSVLVYNRGQCGFSGVSGHIEVVSGANKVCSDFCSSIRSCRPRIYAPAK